MPTPTTTKLCTPTKVPSATPTRTTVRMTSPQSQEWRRNACHDSGTYNEEQNVHNDDAKNHLDYSTYSPDSNVNDDDNIAQNAIIYSVNENKNGISDYKSNDDGIDEKDNVYCQPKNDNGEEDQAVND